MVVLFALTKWRRGLIGLRTNNDPSGSFDDATWKRDVEVNTSLRYPLQISMSIPENHPAPTITATLLDALSQSQALVRQLEEQSRTIDRLKRQNEQLQQELDGFRTRQLARDREGDVSDQLDQIFREDAERQAEMDRLKQQLQAVQNQERNRRTQNTQVPSPLVSSDEVGDVEAVPSSSPLLSPLIATFNNKAPQHGSHSSPNNKTQQLSSPPRKRARIDSPDATIVQDLPEHQRAQRKVHVKAKDRANRGAEAIPAVTEDGEDHIRSDDSKPADPKSSEKRDTGVYKRLDALLAAPSPSNTHLSRSEHRSGRSASPVAKPARAPFLCKSSSDLARDAVVLPTRPLTRFLPPRPRPSRGPEDDEPLRSRPLSRLNLSHFKLNPDVNDGYALAYGETVRNKEARKCLPGCVRPECCGGQMEALADTLAQDISISEDDLLIYLLGPRSEDKIRGLTDVARENLLYEARAKRVADTYGKMHRHLHQRAQSPINFWSADMPGSQEEKKHRDEAKRREREEVERRQREALQGDGKWVFADE